MNGGNPKQVIKIYNILRALGLNTSLKGSKFLNKAIQIMLACNNDFVAIKDIYIIISKEYCHSTPNQIKNYIAYSLNNRVEEKSINNFEKIFGYEYDKYIFTNKSFIEEVTRVIAL